MFDYVIESRQEGIPVVAAYLRVSTDKQTVLNQKSEVLKFCRRQDLEITLWCMETVSGKINVSSAISGAGIEIIVIAPAEDADSPGR